MEGFYTANEAQKRLGVTHDKFQYMVRSNQVKKVILPARKYGVYPKEQINRLAAAMEAAAELYVHDATVFEVATPADLPEIYALVKANMPRVTPIEAQQAWMERNPESFYTLRDNGILVAYACLLSVNYEWLERVLKDEVRIGSVPPKEMYQFNPGKPLDLYIRDIIVGKTDRSKLTHYAQRLIFELMHVFSQWGARGIEIRAIYARATTPQAHNLCQRLHFIPLIELDPKIEGKMSYRLEVATATSPLLDNYKKGFEQYQDSHQS